MSRSRRQRDTQVFSLSFLDAISCGFGAIVLLLVIVRTAEPTRIVEEGQGLEALRQELAMMLPELETRAERLEDELDKARAEAASLAERIAELAPRAEQRRQQRAAAELDARAAETEIARLERAQQELTEQMRRLLDQGVRVRDDRVGGIPVDSEYIIFIIDTSGSMTRFAWPTVQRKLEETLDIYPRVEGIQIMSDMGDHMFSRTAGEWIPDTPARRRIILDRLRNWEPFSNSSPVEGIVRAINTYAAPDKRISIYVYGDDFTGSSIQQVLDTVARVTPVGPDGEPRVRIHGVGFPVLFQQGPQPQQGGDRFGHLMRSLAAQTGGTFVALDRLR